MNKSDKRCSTDRDPVAIWDDIIELLAEDDAENGEPTEEDRRWSKVLDARVRSRVAELRRRLTPTDVPIQRGVTIPPEVEAMTRDALVAQVEIMRQMDKLRYAHRDLTGLSDHNLRILLVVAMRSNRR